MYRRLCVHAPHKRNGSKVENLHERKKKNWVGQNVQLKLNEHEIKKKSMR